MSEGNLFLKIVIISFNLRGVELSSRIPIIFFVNTTPLVPSAIYLYVVEAENIYGEEYRYTGYVKLIR